MVDRHAVQHVLLGLDPSISCKRFSGLRFAPPENDGSFASRKVPPRNPLA
jgi:hypothetical protein